MKQPGFIFGGNTNLSYDQIQKQRDIANELLRANMSTPQNVGEGLSAIGRALAAKAIDKRTTRADEANRQASEARRADAFGMIFGGGSGGSGAPYSPQPPVAFDPNSPKGVASDTMAALGKSVYTPGDRESFVAAMMPHALRVSQMTGLDPRLVIAQAAQETGWGKSSPNNNYFGIKSHGKGGANLGTFEYVNGQRVNVNDSFRTYDSMGQSAEDYARFLMENPRYKDMLAAGDLEGQLAALGRSGYATDPNYASSVGSIASSIQIPGMSAPQSGGAPSAPAMGNPATIQVIADLLADPYTPPGEKAMLEQAMAMQLQGMDPMRQMEMEKARLELDQMRNPQPGFTMLTDEQEAAMGLNPAGVYQQGADGSIRVVQDAPSGPNPTSAMQEYEFARSQGYEGTFQQYQADLKKAGATSVTVDTGGEVGTIPQGYELFTDPATGARSMRPIPGGPEDPTKANEKAAGGRDIATQTVTSAAQRAREAADSRMVSGALSGIAAMNPASDNAEIYRQVEVLKSQAIVGNLQAMRDASPTGGALGAVTAPELKMLADKSGALDPRSPNFIRDLNDYELSLLQVIHGPEEGQRIFEATRQGAASAVTADPEIAAAVAADPEGFAKFKADPSAVAAAQKYGVTLEEMWAIKRGQNR
jgi:flagellum-specific peptidoglycan hydrolase FlgJ